MSDTGELAATAAKAAEPVIGGAISGNVGALIFLVIFGGAVLAGVYIWRNPRTAKQSPDLPTAACSECQRTQSGLDAINLRLKEAQDQRTEYYRKNNEDLSHINKRIDEMVSRHEHDSTIKLISQQMNETNTLLGRLVSGVHA